MTTQDEKLMSAVINGDQDAAVEAIVAGANIHLKTAKGNNLLFLASSRNQKDMFDWLLEIEKDGKKIDLNEKNIEGATVLFECLKDPSLEDYVEKLLEVGANPNICLEDGTSPLIHACAFKMDTIVDLLIKYNVDLNYFVPDTKTTALMTAANQPSLEIVKKLIDAGVDKHFVDDSNRNVLIATLFKGDHHLKKREKKEYVELCNYLCTLDFNYDVTANSGLTAFWAASLNRLVEPCKLMLERGVNPDVWHEVGIDMGKTSALHLWCNFKEEAGFDLMREMVKSGAKLGAKDSNGNMPESFGFLIPELRPLMMELNADVNAVFVIRDKLGNVTNIPSISSIVNNGDKQIDLVKEMIAKGVKLSFDESDDINAQPILIAIKSGAIEILKEIIDSKQVDLNKEITVSSGYQTVTPLIVLASEEQNAQLQSYLEQKVLLNAIKVAKEQNLQKGVKSDLLKDKDFKDIDSKLNEINSIEQQLKDRKIEMLNLLLAAGADINALNSQQKNALFFVKSEFFTNLLIEKNCNIFQEDSSKNNAFLHSFISGKKEVVKTMKSWLDINSNEILEKIFYDISFTDSSSSVQQGLLEKSLMAYVENDIDKEKFYKEKDYKANVENINYKDEDGNSPVLIACANNLPFLVSIFERLGADLNATNNLNETPIMHAIATKNSRLIDFLIEKKVDLEITTKEGKSVLDFALETEDLVIIEAIKRGLNPELSEGAISGIVKLKP